MTRTRRIYNRFNLKKTHRNNLIAKDNPYSDLERVGKNTFRIKNPSLINSVHAYGFVYHPYTQLCMGNCSFCKDHSKDYRRIRKVIKREFRRLLPWEF